MPRTSYRFRVAAVFSPNAGEESQDLGEWSDVTNIATRDNQTFDINTHSGAQSVPVSNQNIPGKKKKTPKNSLIFEKAGTIMGAYGYSFADHLWEIKISYSPGPSQNYMNQINGGSP